ncbi:hypothetical protein [Comamonas aquatica]
MQFPGVTPLPKPALEPAVFRAEYRRLRRQGFNRAQAAEMATWFSEPLPF